MTAKKIKVMQLSAGDQTDLDEKGDVFSEWYNEEKAKLCAEETEESE